MSAILTDNPDTLIRTLQAIVLELKELTQQQIQGDIIPYEQAMDYLQCSRASLDRMRADGLIKVYQFKGKRRLYVKRHELTEMLETVESKNEKKERA